MKKTLMEIYALAVCFASMICISISSGTIVYDLAQIAYPEITIDSYKLEGSFPPPYPMVMHGRSSATAEAVNVDSGHSKSTPPHMLPPPLPPEAIWGEQLFSAPLTVPGISAQDLEKNKQQRVERALKYEQNDAKRSLIQMLIILLVSGVVFFIHWRLAKRCK